MNCFIRFVALFVLLIGAAVSAVQDDCLSYTHFTVELQSVQTEVVKNPKKHWASIKYFVPVMLSAILVTILIVNWQNTAGESEPLTKNHVVLIQQKMNECDKENKFHDFVICFVKLLICSNAKILAVNGLQSLDLFSSTVFHLPFWQGDGDVNKVSLWILSDRNATDFEPIMFIRNCLDAAQNCVQSKFAQVVAEDSVFLAAADKYAQFLDTRVTP